ncbi:unnamed protein product [Mytilus coruscus]|uniref:Uncharacterized protein n=1 Tax=Mytilus coruscus TaxID=42192 RepID=A0A6J8EWW2_MYTCO|nr:unnamed protein product [Mytilus coruscus]
MSSFPVLIAGHSQTKYFKQYLSLSKTNVLSYSGFRIDQMFNELQPTIDNYNTVVLHVGANDLSRGSSVKILLRKYQQLTSDIWHSNPTADRLPTSTSNRSPTFTSNRLPTSTSNRSPTSTSNRLPTATSNRLPTSTSNRLPTSTSNRLPTSTSNRLPTSTSNRLPTSTSNHLPA